MVKKKMYKKMYRENPLLLVIMTIIMWMTMMMMVMGDGDDDSCIKSMRFIVSYTNTKSWYSIVSPNLIAQRINIYLYLLKHETFAPSKIQYVF